MEFMPRDPQVDLQKYAKDYETLETKDNLIEEEYFFRKRGSRWLDKGMLKRVAHWKSPRSAGHVENNSDDYVKEITGFVFEAKEERSRIEILTVLSGVEWPTASVILHFFHPDPYPILDFRALWSLNREPPTNTTSHSGGPMWIHAENWLNSTRSVCENWTGHCGPIRRSIRKLCSFLPSGGYTQHVKPVPL